MATGTYLESEAAGEGGRAMRDAADVAWGELVQHINRVRQLIDARPAGSGEEGARFEEAHDAVATALDAVGKLWGLVDEMAENVIIGSQGTVADDELASRIVGRATDVRDIPDIPF